MPKYKTCIFVHGCFWHRHRGFPHNYSKTRKSFWEAKFESNVQRDRENQRKLKELGWQVEIIWECELSKPNVSTCMAELVVRIGSRQNSLYQDIDEILVDRHCLGKQGSILKGFILDLLMVSRSLVRFRPPISESTLSLIYSSSSVAPIALFT